MSTNATRDALIAVSVISLIPNLFLLLIPSTALTKEIFGINVQHVLLSFASGGLLGDVFIHTLPHLLLSEVNSFGVGDMHMRSILIGSISLFGFFIFFVVEKLVSVMNEDKDKDLESESNNILKGKAEPPSHHHEHSHSPSLSTSGILNIVADIMHNFTDGLAIGATYSSPNGSLGLAATISIFFHEIPHELGDFSILIESGYTKMQAIQAQLVTAMAAILGTMVGLCCQKNPILEDILLSITCGGFVYVATVGVLPMLSQRKPSGSRTKYTQISLEALGVSIITITFKYIYIFAIFPNLILFYLFY